MVEAVQTCSQEAQASGSPVGLGWFLSQLQSSYCGLLALAPAFDSGVWGTQSCGQDCHLLHHIVYLRQCSDGRDTSLFLNSLDSVATGAAGGELQAGPDH